MGNVTLCLALLLALATPSGEVVSGRFFESRDLAREVVRLMQSAPVSVFATTDPMRPDRFVAVLFVPRRLHVIASRHARPAEVAKDITSGQYRRVYQSLRRASLPGKFFVQDANANGLLTIARGQGTSDVVVDASRVGILFNGDPGSQNMTESEYNARFTAADREYARLLTVLKEALERGVVRRR